jgi:hypothetical protein
MDHTVKAYALQKPINDRIKLLDNQVKNGEKKVEDIFAERKALVARLKKPRKWSVNLTILFGGLLVLALLLAVLRSIPEQGFVLWLFYIPPLPKVVGDVSTLLGPLVAVSVAIERLLETLFDTYEQSVRSVADIISAPVDTLDWVGREYKDAYEAAADAAKTVGVNAAPADMDKLNKAEQRLAQAEGRLRCWTTSPEYIAWKRALSIWAGLLVGLLVSIMGDLGMLHMIGIPVPRLMDMLVTGLVIGAGPGPMHSLIGILQSGKDAMDNLSDMAKGKAIKESIDAVNKAEDNADNAG